MSSQGAGIPRADAGEKGKPRAHSSTLFSLSAHRVLPTWHVQLPWSAQSCSVAAAQSPTTSTSRPPLLLNHVLVTSVPPLHSRHNQRLVEPWLLPSLLLLLGRCRLVLMWRVLGSDGGQCPVATWRWAGACPASDAPRSDS